MIAVCMLRVKSSKNRSGNRSSIAIVFDNRLAWYFIVYLFSLFKLQLTEATLPDYLVQTGSPKVITIDRNDATHAA